MSSRSIEITESTRSYLLNINREHPCAIKLRNETLKLEQAMMQISPEQGALMRFLVELIGARKAIEVGVFTGYSSLAMALGMPDDGKIVACDINAEWTAIGRKYWRLAGVEQKIDLRLGPAVETLRELIDMGKEKCFDFAFIDADKVNYDRYYELCLALLRSGGLMLIDNVLWGGRVADSNEGSPETQAIRALNNKVRMDSRVAMCMIPVGDGLTLVRKK